jgi:hypothetical protein
VTSKKEHIVPKVYCSCALGIELQLLWIGCSKPDRESWKPFQSRNSSSRKVNAQNSKEATFFIKVENTHPVTLAVKANAMYHIVAGLFFRRSKCRWNL